MLSDAIVRMSSTNVGMEKTSKSNLMPNASRNLSYVTSSFEIHDKSITRQYNMRHIDSLKNPFKINTSTTSVAAIREADANQGIGYLNSSFARHNDRYDS